MIKYIYYQVYIIYHIYTPGIYIPEYRCIYTLVLRILAYSKQYVLYIHCWLYVCAQCMYYVTYTEYVTSQTLLTISEAGAMFIVVAAIVAGMERTSSRRWAVA